MKVFLLVALLALTGAAQAQDAPGPLASAELSTAEIVEAHFPKTLSLLSVEFPADHNALLRTFEEIDDETDADHERTLLAVREFTELRRKYADRLAFAPTAAHARMLSQLAVFYDAVHRTEGPEICGRFAADGSAVLFDLALSTKYAELIDQQSVAYFEAVVEAIETPENSGVATADDWSAVVRRMVEAGAPPSFAATVAGGDPSDSNLCPALAAMFLTTALLDSPEGARTRADFARNLTGY